MVKSIHLRRLVVLVASAVLICPAGQTVQAQRIVVGKVVDKWVTVTGVAAGETLSSRDEALAGALRKAVEQACGVFLKAQSQSDNYKLVYEKIFADTVGFVREHKVLGTRKTDGKTHVRIRARVSTRKFRKDWATIAHTIERENNPRVIIAIVEATHWTAAGPAYRVEETGTVQSRIEDFFLNKGIVLMDRKVARKVSKRDLLLAGMNDDTKAIAAIGAQFKADVVITGRATGKYSSTLAMEDVKMHQFAGVLNIRAIQTDSARLLVAKNYSVTKNTVRRGSGAQKALAKVADESAPKLLSAIVEAWRKRAYVSRTVQLNVGGMNYATWKRFKTELKKVRGIQALRLREITEKPWEMPH